MAEFTDLGFNPENGLRDTVAYDTVPATEEEARAQIQGISDQIKAFLNGTLIPQLESATTGASGAERIGSAEISGIPGQITIYDQLVALKAQMDDLVAGVVPDEYITNAKLNSDVKVGSLAALTTTEKGSVQGAINELDAEVGDLAALTTSVKTNLVGAINEIDGSSVSEADIINGAVTETKIGADAVTHTKIKDGEVWSSKLATSAVTGAKIANDAVTQEKIYPSAVGTTEIANGAVTSAKINSSAISDSVTSTSSAVCASSKAVKTAYDRYPPSATTSTSGIVALSTSVSSTSTSLAATSSAVKSAYDRGTTALNTANTKEPALASDRKRKITISSSSPSGGSDGDVWIKYS